MSQRKVLLTIFALAATLLISASASADVIGYVYRVPGNLLNAGDHSGDAGAVYEGSFTASVIDFSVPEVQGTSNPLSEFLSTADTLNITSGLGDVMSNCPPATSGCYSTSITIVGSGYFQHNASYTITHDDGVVLNLQGFGDLINAPGPVYISPTTAVFTGASGVYNYTLYYMATNGNPEVLKSNIPTPEPSTLVLLGSGLLGLALRRRRI